jgi:hypothetical protein
LPVEYHSVSRSEGARPMEVGFRTPATAPSTTPGPLADREKPVKEVGPVIAGGYLGF